MILQQLYLTKKVNIRLAFPRTPAVQNRDYSESGRIGYEHLNGYGVRDITVSKALKSVSISSDYSSSSQQHCSRRRHVRFITLGQMLQELTCCSPKPKKIQLSFPFCDSSMSFTRSTEDHKISCPFDKICSSLSCERASQEWDTVQEADSEWLPEISPFTQRRRLYFLLHCITPERPRFAYWNSHTVGNS